MAQSVALFLKADGNDIQGDSTIESHGRKDSIECLSFKDAVRTAREKSSGMAVGRRTYEPVSFTKRIDKATPLLAKALCDNEEICATFKFYRPHPKGDGTTEQFFTVELTGGRIAYIERQSPDAIDPARSEKPPFEEVGLVFKRITWTYEPGSKVHSDDWSEQA